MGLQKIIAGIIQLVIGLYLINISFNFLPFSFGGITHKIILFLGGVTILFDLFSKILLQRKIKKGDLSLATVRRK
tara:strand:+ start:1153 stop:1377 length:225 start_codon:yes stop_codon:yes gene_type:complete